MQCLLGPVLGYAYNEFVFQDYRMELPKETYFGFALPAILAHMAGLMVRLGKKQTLPDLRLAPIDFTNKGRFFIVVGFIGGFLPLGFLAYILGGLKFVGLFYMFVSKSPAKYYWIVPVFGYLIFDSLSQGMFHDFLLWGCFFIMIWFLFNRSTFGKRLGYILAGFVLIFVIQMVKSDYRDAIANEAVTGKGNNVAIFAEVLSSKLSGDQSIFSDQNIADKVVRLNQGWIVARVMQYIPDHEPYANGKTIKDAVVASIFPRFIMPGKANSGGRDNMERYAGIQLNEYTSMDIGQLGEAYANYGVMGGILFMFVLGLFFNWVMHVIEKKTVKYPDLVFWVPLIFLQVIKAETSMVTILNHLTKTVLITWFFFSPWGNSLIVGITGRIRKKEEVKG